MQKLKSKVFEKIQIKNQMQNIKFLLKSPIFQSVVASLASVGLLSWLHIRPLGLIFFTIFCFWFSTNCCNLRIKVSPELKNYLTTLQKRVVAFRKINPTMFSIIGSCLFIVLLILGFLGAGVLLSIIICSTVSAIKSKYNLIEIRREVPSIYRTKEREEESELNKEFLPEESETNMFIMEKASDLSSITFPTDESENEDDISDEVPSELLIPDSIPEVNENSTDDDEDDLLPIALVFKSDAHIKTSNPASDALFEYTESNDNIEFKKGHFKRDSSLSTTSSSSDESLSKGLQFPDHSMVDGPGKQGNSLEVTPAQVQALLGNNNKFLPNLMSGLIQGVFGGGFRAFPTQSGPVQDPTNRRVVTALDSSDDSDFEILDQADFK